MARSSLHSSTQLLHSAGQNFWRFLLLRRSRRCRPPSTTPSSSWSRSSSRWLRSSSRTRCTRRRFRAARASAELDAQPQSLLEMSPPPPPPRSRFGTTAAPASGGVGIDGVGRSCNTTENPEVRAYYVALKKLRRKSVARRRRRSERRVQRVSRHAVQRGAARDVRPAPRAVGRPASAAVWVTTDDGEASVRKSAAAFLAGAPPPLQLQILRGRPTDPYPVNRLRNLAVAAVTASHFFVCDVDLWPSEGAALRALPPSFTTQSKHAMVVPAFEVYSSASCSATPASADARRAQALRAPAVGQLVALRRVQTLDGDAHVDLVPTVVEDRRRRRPVQGAVLRLDPLRAVRPRAEGRRDARL